MQHSAAEGVCSMKKRLGFVSNSSSSSYIVVGVKIDSTEIGRLIGWDWDDDDESNPENFEYLKDTGVFGIVIASNECMDLVNIENVPVTKVYDCAVAVAHKLVISPSEIRIFSGTTMR